MSSPTFTFIVATLNSERTLDACLKSIRQQTFPQDQVEILVVDGGSSDKTVEIARHHKAIVIPNPDVVPVAAKLLGLKHAKGKYLVHLDSDEVFVSHRALEKRFHAFQENSDVVTVFASGYQDPPGSPFVNRYINEFGDPFSMFYYRLSRNHLYFLNLMRARYPVIKETADYLVLELPIGKAQPIMENAANGNAVDVEFFRKNFPDLCANPFGPVHFFYHMQKHTRRFALTKEDPVLHYSADSWKGFLGKIKWRVKNNIFSLGDYGSSGFLGRIEFDSFFAKLRRYLFVPYVALLLPVTLDALYLSLTRRSWRYFGHVPLCLATLVYIAWFYSLKLIGVRPQFRSYGEQSTVRSS